MEGGEGEGSAPHHSPSNGTLTQIRGEGDAVGRECSVSELLSNAGERGRWAGGKQGGDVCKCRTVGRAWGLATALTGEEKTPYQGLLTAEKAILLPLLP